MRTILLLSLTLLLSSCSASSPDKSKELLPKGASKNITTSSEDELVSKAKKLYSERLYSSAKDLLESLLLRFPYTEYAEFAKLKIADSDFLSGDYVSAAKNYDDFIASFPSSPDLAYALFRMAESEQNTHRGAGRDPASLERSLAAYDRLLSMNSELTELIRKSAQNARNDVLTKLAEHEETVAAFYEKAGNDTAAKARKLKGSEFLKRRRL